MAGNSSSGSGEDIDSRNNYDGHNIHGRNDGPDASNDDGSHSSENNWQFQKKRKRTTLVKTNKVPGKETPGTRTTQLGASDGDRDDNNDSQSDDGIEVGKSNNIILKQQIPRGSSRAAYKTIQKRAKSKKRCRRSQKYHDNGDGDASSTATSQIHHVNLFQDDQTGRQYIHPSALRYALKLINEEAHKTTESISLSLSENGEIDESRQVQLRSSDHVKKITSKIRSRLANVKIPARYVKIEDLNLTDLQLTNAQRQHEIDDYKTLVKQLEKQHSFLESEYNEAKAKRDDLQNKLKSLTKSDRNDIVNTTTTPIHPILLNGTVEADQNAFPKNNDLASANNITQTVAPAPKDTMFNFLKDLQSPYD